MSDNKPTAAEILRKHGGMGYGPGAPIRCNCRKVLGGGPDDMLRRYDLLASHQVDMLRSAGLLA